MSLHQRWQLADVLDQIVRCSFFESGARERPPQRGDGGDAGGAPGGDVVRRVADEHRLGGGVSEHAECQVHRFAVRLVALARIEADHDVDQRVHAEALERAVGELGGFAGDECGGMLERFEQCERVTGAGELAQQAIVVLPLMGPVSEHELLHHVLVGHMTAHLCDEWGPDARDPRIIGGPRDLACLEGVMKGGEEKLDRVRECTVEIEQQGEGAGAAVRHAPKLATAGESGKGSEAVSQWVSESVSQ